MEDYYDLIEQVNSKASFLRFLNALIDDWNDSQEKENTSHSSPISPDANDWENPSLGRFLEAMYASSSGLSKVPEEPSWRTFAEMFAVAKVYE